MSSSPYVNYYDFILAEIKKEREMKQNVLPLPFTKDELPLETYVPIRYCANCGRIVRRDEALNTNTKSFCTLSCQQIYARSVL